MTTEMWIIAAVRVLGSLPVLRWPFWGAIFVLLVDLSDLFMMNLLHLGGVKGYQSFDKWLDQPYMLFFLIVSLRWEPALRNMTIGLYVFRAAGFIAFDVAGERDILHVGRWLDGFTAVEAVEAIWRFFTDPLI